MFRRAGVDDAVTLLDLERSASTAALGHVFGADIPFPAGDVLARWTILVSDPSITVLIDEHVGEPIGYAAYGGGWLHHFGYAPSQWGTGRAERLHDAVVEAMRAVDDAPLRLWVLVENHRARRFYSRMGWTDAGVREQEVFRPFPEKMQLRLNPS